MTEKELRDEWRARLQAATHAIRHAHDAIERLSEIAPCDVDMKVCFASNTTYGAEALLREADSLMRRRKKRSRS